MINKKALIAMSGGVDSAVAALLIKNMGYQVEAITMQLFDGKKAVHDGIPEHLDDNSIQAKKTAELLNIPHISVSLGESFSRCVISPFIEDYKNGKTPNPCVQCNKHIKFGRLLDIAEEKSFDYLVTGHYAKIEQDNNGHFFLKKAADEKKDQTYFLWSLNQNTLSKVLFPLGDYTKEEIKSIARDNNFSSADRSESQDICFIPDGNYADFLRKSGHTDFSIGNFIDIYGNILGRHAGLENYTIGQRKGLGIALGKPMFVAKKDPSTNSVILCTDLELYKKELQATSVNLLINDTLEQPMRLSAKIRYRHTPAAATVIRTDTDRISITFDEPQRAITPGQSVVLYDGDIVVGGGIIE